MIIAGLTGSIGMGKSTTARMFAEEGAAVFDADAVVHALYAPGGAAIEPLLAEFGPDILTDGGIDRSRLSDIVRNDPAAFATLDAIVHPLVREQREAFIAAAREEGRTIAVFDIPLLFETGGDQQMDVVIVVTAPPDVQRERVMARDGMTQAKFDAILTKQMPDSEKRARADFVVDTSQGMDAARDQVRQIVHQLERRAQGDLA